jgi:hypothetical protein
MTTPETDELTTYNDHLPPAVPKRVQDIVPLRPIKLVYITEQEKEEIISCVNDSYDIQSRIQSIISSIDRYSGSVDRVFLLLQEWERLQLQTRDHDIKRTFVENVLSTKELGDHELYIDFFLEKLTRCKLDEIRLLNNFLSFCPDLSQRIQDEMINYSKEETMEALLLAHNSAMACANSLIKIRIVLEDVLVNCFDPSKSVDYIRNELFPRLLSNFDTSILFKLLESKLRSCVKPVSMTLTDVTIQDELRTIFDGILLLLSANPYNISEFMEDIYYQLRFKVTTGAGISEADYVWFSTLRDFYYGTKSNSKEYSYLFLCEQLIRDFQLSRRMTRNFNEKNAVPFQIGFSLVRDVDQIQNVPAEVTIPWKMNILPAFYDDLIRKPFEQVCTGRSLKWRLDLGSASVLFYANHNREFELVVSTIQMAILLLYNKYDEISLEQIFNEFDIKETEEQEYIANLVVQLLSKRVLKLEGKKEPPSPKTTMLISDRIFVNESFKSKVTLIRMSILPVHFVIRDGIIMVDNQIKKNIKVYSTL